MNFIKRAFTSVTRQIGKSMILGVITLLLAVVMITTLLMDQSSTSAKNAVIKTLPPLVELTENYDLFSDTSMTQEKYMELIKNSIPLTPKVAEDIYQATSDLVDFYDYMAYGTLMLHKSIVPVTVENQMGGSYGPNIAGSEYTNYMTALGSRLSEFMEIRNQKITLKEGRLISEEEIKAGKPVVLLSVEFAEKNNLRVGDKITSMNQAVNYSEQGEATILFEQPYEFEIVGLIDMQRPTEEQIKNHDQSIWMYEQFANTLRVPSTIIEKMYNEVLPYNIDAGMIPEGIPTEYQVSGVTFSLKKATDSEKFVKLAKAVYDSPNKMYQTQQDQVNRVAGPITQTQNMIRMVFYGTVVASVLILSLVLTLFVRDRKKEIGIYLALGEKKSLISGQLIVEALIIALVAATIAIVFGYFLGGALSNSMIQKALEQAGGGMFGMMGQPSTIDIKSIVENYKIGLDVLSILIFYATIIGTVVVAQVVTALYILRLDPKKIMM